MMRRPGLWLALIAASLALVPAAAAQQVSSLSSPLTSDQVQAAMPPVCSTVPPMDTATGSVGSAIACTPRSDATRRTVIQGKDTTTAADATYAITWDTPFATTPIYADARVNGTGQPFVCTVTATTTGASGKCFQLVSTTLPTVTTSLLGLVVSPISNAAAGLSVRVVARQ